jgi:anti-anti-sigma factor
MTTPQQNLQSVLALQGNIVAAEVPQLRVQFRALVEGGAPHLVLDLSQVRMVDSMGIGLLISLHNTLKKSGRQLSVIHVSKDILDLFRTMRMHTHFSISGD